MEVRELAGQSQEATARICSILHEIQETTKNPAKPTVVVSDALDTEAEALYRQGYQLVGFSKFVSPLAPMLAKANASATAQARGADYVLANRPQPASLGQHFYLATYWRSPEPRSFILGAYYDDPPATFLAMIGCRAGIVAITGVVPATPAQQAGLRDGDVVRSVAGSPVSSAAQLDDLIVQHAGRRVLVRHDTFPSRPAGDRRQLGRIAENQNRRCEGQEVPADLLVDEPEEVQDLDLTLIVYLFVHKIINGPSFFLIVPHDQIGPDFGPPQVEIAVLEADVVRNIAVFV